MTLGEIIKKYRNEHNVSMEYVANLCGITKGYVAMLERNVNSKTGRPVKPSIETIIKICNGLHFDFNEVFALLDDDYEISLSSSEKPFSEKKSEPADELTTLSGFSNEERLILAFFDELNDEGKALMLDYAELLYSSDKYKKRACSDVEKKAAV